MSKPKFQDLTAVILAGGLGTRLRSVVSDKPKVLAPVSEKPFLEYLFLQLEQFGIQHIVLCTGHMAAQVEEYFGEKYREITVSYSIETSPLGTGGAIRNAMSHIQSDPFLVMNGDSFCEADLSKFYDSHLSNDANASILLTEVDDTSRYGKVEFSDTQQVQSFQEKNATEGSGWINAGIYFLSKKAIMGIEEGKNISIEKEVFPDLVGQNFYTYLNPAGLFIDIGTPESFELADKLFAEDNRAGSS